MKYLFVVCCLLTTACTTGNAFVFTNTPKNPDILVLEKKLKKIGYKVTVNDFMRLPNVRSGVIICSSDHPNPSDINLIKENIEELGYLNTSVYTDTYENHTYRTHNVGIYLSNNKKQ